MHFAHKNITAIKQKARLGLQLKLVRFISYPEPKLARLINRIETDPIFEKIRPFISRLPLGKFWLPLANWDAQNIQADDHIPWSEFSYEISLISKIGQKAFEKYFLYDDIGFTTEEIALKCHINCDEIKRIRAFLFTLSMQAHSFKHPKLKSKNSVHYTAIAKIYLHNGIPKTAWKPPHLARGRYKIDYNSLKMLMNSRFTAGERKKASQILRMLELINMRNKTILHILESIIKIQRKFLKTDKPIDLTQMSPSALARHLGVYPSTVTRAISRRSMVTPQNKEFPLLFFLPNQKRKIIMAITETLVSGKKMTDFSLAAALRDKYRISISRRTVNNCRHVAMKNLNN